MAVRPRRAERGKDLRLARWNAERVRGKELELEHFLNQHGVDVCILSETFLNPGQAFRLANYVCHRTHRLTAGGGTAILVRLGIVHHSVSVPDLTHLEATAIQVTLAGKPVKILAAYISPSRPLIVADLSVCFGGGLSVLTAGDLNDKHVDWNTWLSTRRGKLLREYADENSCLIFGPDTQPPTHTTPPPIPVSWTSWLRVAHPLSTHRFALISGALTGPYNYAHIRPTGCTVSIHSPAADRTSLHFSSQPDAQAEFTRLSPTGSLCASPPTGCTGSIHPPAANRTTLRISANRLSRHSLAYSQPAQTAGVRPVAAN